MVSRSLLWELLLTNAIQSTIPIYYFSPKDLSLSADLLCVICPQLLREIVECLQGHGGSQVHEGKICPTADSSLLSSLVCLQGIPRTHRVCLMIMLLQFRNVCIHLLADIGIHC